MNIQGLQKTTLLDYPGKVACTIFTGGCNFRCPFCHNSELWDLEEKPSELTYADILSFLRKRQGILDGVCISGGEPLLHEDTEELLRDIRSLGYAIKLDTNGSRPKQLKALVSAGLVDYVAMDIKNTPEKYPLTIGKDDFDMALVEETVQYLLSDAVDYEFRTTVIKPFHQETDFALIGQWIKGAKRYFLQGFIDSEQVLYDGLESATAAEMRGYLEAVKPYVAQVTLRGIDDI